MSTSSEDVLLQIAHVRFKKNDGTLYVLSERLGWMMENKDTLSVSHKYADIKLQKISPEGKPKIQLQMVLHDGGASTFHFNNPHGQAQQIKDRDQVKERLQQLLPQFKRKVNKELEEKNKLLSENKQLLDLYCSLVVTNVITSEEFWQQHAPYHVNKQVIPQQDVGVSGAFLADIKPQPDGCNGLKYNLTTDIIESIFKTFPIVKTKHQDYVPNKLSESEFWTRFFQSHYFHRDRISTGTKDLFSECAKHDEKELKSVIHKGVDNPLVNLQDFEDKTLGDGFGDVLDKPSSSSVNIVHENIIKRFNQHSIMVMRASEKATADASAQSQISSSNKGSTNGAVELPSMKRKLLQDKMDYEDLRTPPSAAAPTLQLAHKERYLHGPMAIRQEQKYVANDSGPSKEMMRREIITAATRRSKGQQMPHASSSTAISVLGELSPGGALMKNYNQNSLSQLVPKEIEDEIRNLYVAVCELLRHFWTCFPPTTQALEEKATRMHEALARFHSMKLKALEERCIREHVPTSVLLHLNQLLNASFHKYRSWQQKRLQHGLR